MSGLRCAVNYYQVGKSFPAKAIIYAEVWKFRLSSGNEVRSQTEPTNYSFDKWEDNGEAWGKSEQPWYREAASELW